jgi:RNA polymerase sigma-70 factor (ECF subfamily)
MGPTRESVKSDIDLMLAVQRGDEEAFSELVGRHRNKVVSLAFRYLKNRADAEDLTQEIFWKIYRARSRYEPQAKFTTWLYRIAANSCLNEVRNRKNRPTHGAASLYDAGGDESAAARVADEASLAPEEAVEQDELKAQVRAAVDALPERQRLAILLNKFHGLGYEELAAAMDMTVPGVKSLLVRARENVRRRIEPYLARGTERKGTA